VPLTTILMLLAPDDAALALGRFDAFVRSSPAFQAEITTSSPGFATVYRATFRHGQSGRMRLNVAYAGGSFAMSLTERGRVDLDASESLYDEYPVNWPSQVVPSRLTDDLQIFFPGFLTAKSSRNWFFTSAKLAYSRVGDRSVVSAKSEIGDVRAEFLPNGQLVKLRQTQISQLGSQTFDYEVKSWKPIPDALAQFSFSVPSGYTPISVSDYGYPADVGARAQLGTWIEGGKSTNVDSLAQKVGAILVFADPSNASGQLLAQSMAKMNPQTVPVLKLADGKVAAGWSTNPDGKFLRSINPPGSPYVVIVGKDGRIKNQWFGISAASAASFVQEVDLAVETLLNPPAIPPKSSKPGPRPSNSGSGEPISGQ